VESRARAERDLARLPEPLRRLKSGTAYRVEVADALHRLAAEVDQRIAQQKKAPA
jgi:nicotinate phosphoribosyltransferase